MVDACLSRELLVAIARPAHAPLDGCRDANTARVMADQMGTETLGIILQLAAIADGDYCDLGESVFNLVRHRLNALSTENHHG